MKHAATPILAAGVTAGTLDIAYAGTFWAVKAGVPFLRILQSVAAGLLGRDSFQGGPATALLGLGLHMGIAVAMAAFYYLAAGRLPLLRRRPLFCGCTYGLLLYFFMQGVVVPLSAASAGAKDPLWIGCTIAAHMLLVGTPIAVITARALKHHKPPI